MFLGRVVGPGDPQWLDEDREKVHAVLHAGIGECANCGSREEDWRDADGFPLEEPTWMVDFVHCLGCDEIERAQRFAAEQKGRGVTVRLVPFLSDEDEEAD